MSDDEETTPEVAPKILWMACRATPGCEGRTAQTTLQFESSQGQIIRYLCLTCKRHWQVSLGGGVVQ